MERQYDPNIPADKGIVLFELQDQEGVVLYPREGEYCLDTDSTRTDKYFMFCDDEGRLTHIRYNGEVYGFKGMVPTPDTYLIREKALFVDDGINEDEF